MRKKKVLQAGEPSSSKRMTMNPKPQSLQAEQEAAETLLGVNEHVENLEAALNASNDILIAQCEHLLTAGLASSRLPELTQARIRKQFAGKAFKASELNSAITEAKEEVSSLLAGQVVHGPARVSGMFSSGDQFQTGHG